MPCPVIILNSTNSHWSTSPWKCVCKKPLYIDGGKLKCVTDAPEDTFIEGWTVVGMK